MAAVECCEPDLHAVQQKLGVTFSNDRLLLQALTHPSYINELAAASEDDNQRLEFLGDAILGFLVGEWLYALFPQAREGELTSLRAHLVRTKSLAAFARDLELGSNMRFGRGERASGGARREANLCAAFEALVGALYLDSGLENTRTWLRRLLVTHSDDIDSHHRARDAKSVLQEAVQSRRKLTPVYTIVNIEGPDHARLFSAEVSIGDEVWGRGTGGSKQAAEQAAAADALDRMHAQGQ